MTSEIGATPGLLGLWHMNEGSGTVVNDSSGSAINGTAVNAPTWTTGTTFTNAASNALTLNGTNQYVTMGASPGLRSSTFTVELWFRRTAAGLGTSTGNGGVTAVPLITKGRAEGETAAQDVNYFFGIDTATGKLAADFEEAQTGASPSLNHPIIGNTVVTLERVARGRRHLRRHDVAPVPRRRCQTGPSWSASRANAAVTSATAIGSALTSTGVADGFFAGQIDEARIWSTARSQSEIQASMNTEIGPTNGLLGLWHLNATSGTTAADGAGNATLNNGTVTPTATWSPGIGMPFPTTSGLQLNGTNQYVTMGASPGLRSSTFTVELWFRRTGDRSWAPSTGNGGGRPRIPLITKGRAEGETAAARRQLLLRHRHRRPASWPRTSKRRRPEPRPA